MVDHRFFPNSKPLAIRDILHNLSEKALEVQLQAYDIEITGVAEPRSVTSQDICFVAKDRYLSQLDQTSAAFVFLSENIQLPDNVRFGFARFARPQHAFIQAAEMLLPSTNHRLAHMPQPRGLASAQLENDVDVAQNTTIGNGAQIGAGTRIGPGTSIGPAVAIGRNCLIESNVTIECALIGDGVTIRSGARVGGVGFGWLDHASENTPIPQLGRAILQNNCEIGINSVVDRGALGDTEIAENAKIGNLVQIGHNCRVGRNSMIAPMSGLSGATIVGENVIMAAGSQSAGHLTIGDNSFVHAGAAVTKDWPAGSRIIGQPARPTNEFWRELATVRRISKGGKNE